MEMNNNLNFETCIDLAGTFHGSRCAGTILGTRMAILGLSEIGIKDPRGADRKNFVVYVETDRCPADAILAVTGCHPGKRSMKILDYGKMAATFVNLKTGRAVRVFEKRKHGNNVLTREDIEKSPHTEEYAMMPLEDLFEIVEVQVELKPENLPGGKPLRIITCEVCGEQVMDMRDVRKEGKCLCRPCATGQNYYSTQKGI